MRRDVEPRHKPAPAQTSPTILLVEPDRDTRDFLRAVLEQRGFRVTCAESGVEALRAADERLPPLVLLEVRLDAMSGYEVCRALREAHGTDVLIVLMSSDRTEPLDRAAGLLIGADDYLTKPISADELLARVRALLRRHTATRGAHDRGRPVGLPHGARARGPPPARRRTWSGRDRHQARDRAQDRRQAHRAHPAQARRAQPRRGSGNRLPARTAHAADVTVQGIVGLV